VVAVDLDRMPAEGPRTLGVDVEVPAEHRLAPLPETVDVENRGEVVELVVGGVFERLPHGPLGGLAVAAENPGTERDTVEVLPSERDADPDRKALAERAGRNVDPRENRRRMTLEAAAERPVGQELVVRDRVGRPVDSVQERRGVD